MRRLLLVTTGLSLVLPVLALADESIPVEADYYPISRFELPEEAVLEASAFQLMPDGRMAVATRRGEIWMISEPFSETVKPSQFRRFAHGMHEVLSLAERDGWLYLVQRGEVSRIRDTTADGHADAYEVVNDDWGLSHDYHEYAFGSKFDAEGNLWVTLCLTGSFSSQVPFRGWAVRITPEGEMIPTCSGVRSPGGVGMNASGDVFFTDNQGPWNGTCALKHLKPGKFMGHPGGNEWYKLAENVMGPRPSDPESGSRIMVEAKKIPEFEPWAVMFPYRKMGQSASGVACDTTGGKFGPFEGQLFVGDHTHSTVMRVSLELVQGHYQGACYPCLEGFGSGTLGIEMTPQGALFVGGTSRGWGARGNLPFSVERVDWTGKVPFEILEMSARTDGFELSFTQPADPETAADPGSYTIETYTYIYQAPYGSPEVDHTSPTIDAVTVSEDGTSARLHITGLQEGHVHELHASGVRSAEGLPLLHPQAYYTLNFIPEAE
jgi:glucose/arabinose dehydrogenase